MKRKIKSQQFSTLSLPNRLVQVNLNTVRIGDFILTLEAEQISWWRYLIFATVVANITLSIPFLVDGVPVSFLGNTLFFFDNYSFAIWLLPISFFIFGIVQLTPRTYTNNGYDQFCRPLFFTTLLQLSCLKIFENQSLPGIILLIGTLVSSILLFNHAQKVLNKSSVKLWLQVPFSLYMACLSITTIMIISGWLKSVGFTGYPMEEISFTILMIVLSTALGVYMTFWKQDFVFPLVIAWSNISLWLEHGQVYPSIAIIALTLGIFMIWCAVIAIIVHSNLTKADSQII